MRKKTGDIVHIDGRTVGTHNGIIHYTIGQRKGLGIGGGVSENNEPLFVVKLDPTGNRVIVGPKTALARDVVYLDTCNWLDTDTSRIRVKLRSVSEPSDATLYVNEDGTAEIHLDAPQYGISPGQAAVCYDGDRVLGGGWITGTENKAMPLAA